MKDLQNKTSPDPNMPHTGCLCLFVSTQETLGELWGLTQIVPHILKPFPEMALVEIINDLCIVKFGDQF